MTKIELITEKVCSYAGVDIKDLHKRTNLNLKEVVVWASKKVCMLSNQSIIYEVHVGRNTIKTYCSKVEQLLSDKDENTTSIVEMIKKECAKLDRLEAINNAILDTFTNRDELQKEWIEREISKNQYISSKEEKGMARYMYTEACAWGRRIKAENTARMAQLRSLPNTEYSSIID